MKNHDRTLAWPALALCLTPLFAACAAGGESLTGSGGAGAGAPTSSSSASGTGTGGTGGDVLVTTSSSGTGGVGGQTLLAYGHTNKTLYELDPKAPDLAPKAVGDFDCIGGAGEDSLMTDLAVDDQGKIWGISETAVYELAIQGATVHCASKVLLNNAQNVKFYALTFVPAGILDPTKEVLLAGNTAGELWAVDKNGGLTLHGNFGNVPANDGNGHNYPAANQGKRWELSGDIVFLANNGNPIGFATVRDCPSPPSATGCSTTDTLVQVDMTALKTATTGSVTLSVRGQIVKRAGCNDGVAAYGGMYGIAAWEDKVYATSHSGAIVEISNVDGTACTIKNMPTTYWDGAGVSTLAPAILPPPK